MKKDKTVTKNLVLLLGGLLLICLLQKNGNFFPVFFIIVSIFLIIKNKPQNLKDIASNISAGICLSILSLNPIYMICIALGYVGARQIYDKADCKINLLPGTKKELFFWGLLPAILLTVLNSIWIIQDTPINFSFRISAISAGLIASIPEEVLFRYLVFALCVFIRKGKTFSKNQSILCYLILIIPHVLMHFPIGEITVIDFGLMCIFGVVLTLIQRKSSLALAIIVHFIIDFCRILIFGI